eukprot:3571402-Amphidinium_carterae.1
MLDPCDKPAETYHKYTGLDNCLIAFAVWVAGTCRKLDQSQHVRDMAAFVLEILQNTDLLVTDERAVTDLAEGMWSVTPGSTASTRFPPHSTTAHGATQASLAALQLGQPLIDRIMCRVTAPEGLAPKFQRQLAVAADLMRFAPMQFNSGIMDRMSSSTPKWLRESARAMFAPYLKGHNVLGVPVGGSFELL